MNDLMTCRSSSPAHASPPQIRPLYWEQLRHYPPANPILIAVDRWSVQTIQRYRGVCLFCPEPPAQYRLGFCYRREIWVLYARPALFSQAMALAHHIQWQGAAHLVVLRMQNSGFSGARHE